MKIITKTFLIGIPIIILISVCIFVHEPPLFVEEPIPEELLLKASKEKILESREVDWIVDGTNKGRIIEYDYITDRKATGKYIWHKGKYTNARISGAAIHFFIGDHWAKDGEDVYEIEHNATTTIEVFEKQTKPDLISRLKSYFIKSSLADTYYAGGGDGEVYKDNSTGWDTIHNATDGTATIEDTAGYNAYVGKLAGGNFILHRGFFPIDTSALAADATITEAKFYFYPTVEGAVFDDDNDGDDYVAVVETTQPDHTDVTTADYDLCGDTHSPTIGSDQIDLGDLTGGQYNFWTLDATGRGWVKRNGEDSTCGTDLTGWTCLGMREGHDLIDSAFAGANGQRNGLYGWYSEQTGTDQDPYLSVTLEAAAAPSKKVQEIIIFD